MAGIDEIIGGQLFDALLTPFNAGFITPDVFYLALLSAALIFIYIKSDKNLGLTSVSLILTSGVMIPNITPDMQIYFWTLMFFGVIGSIYSMFKGN